MNFCENCGHQLSENSQFCENCGTKIINKNAVKQNTFNTNRRKINSKHLIFGIIGALLIVFMIYNLFSSNSSTEGKMNKDEYMTIYDKAIKETEKANFIPAKVELEKLQNTKSYDGIDIKKDIDMTLQLFGIRNFVSSKDLSEEDIIEELEKTLNKFDGDFKNSKSKIKKASDTFIDESKTFLELLKSYVAAEKAINNSDRDETMKQLEKLKEYKFTTPKFEDMARSKVSNIENSIHITDGQKSVENNHTTSNNTTSDNAKSNTNASNTNNKKTIHDQYNRLQSIIESDFKGTLTVGYSSWHNKNTDSLVVQLTVNGDLYTGSFSYSSNGEWIYVEFDGLPGKNYNSYRA